jgi:hypothetical protein
MYTIGAAGLTRTGIADVLHKTWGLLEEDKLHHRIHPRRLGKSKYGLKRIFKVLLDLLVIKFLDRYMTKPIYIFGGFGLFSMALSFVVLSLALYLRLFEGVSLILTPLPLLAAMAFLIACDEHSDGVTRGNRGANLLRISGTTTVPCSRTY